MRFSLGWLRDYVELPEDAVNLGRVLTAIGFAVEAIEEVDGDSVLDLEITTNRPDAMCHVGLARELAVKLGRPFRPPSSRGLREAAVPASASLEVEVRSYEDCPWYSARIVRGVRVAPSPDWLQRRLRAIGVNPINNVVDVTNYVLWETGQPLHAFDLGRLRARATPERLPHITVRRAEAGESLTTLDGQDRRLDPRMLVIADDRGPIGLAGVMGGEAEKVTERTVEIALEAAHFSAARVRLTSKLLAVHTDASHRFERGADPEAPEWASARAVALIAEIAGGEILSGRAEQRAPRDEARAWGEIDRRRLCRFAGFELEAREIVDTLQGLGFEIEANGDDVWRACPPSWRHADFIPSPDGPEATRHGRLEEADLFEEVLRIAGLDRVPSSLPTISGRDGGEQSAHDRRERVRDVLATFGLAEAVTYSFLAAADDRRFTPLVAGEPLSLENPISEGYQVLRRSALPTLLEAVSFNLRRGAEAVRLFETGKIYSTVDEVEVVAVVLGGGLGTPWEGVWTLGFVELKGVVEELFASFDRRVSFAVAEVAGLVVGMTAEILCDGLRVGMIGQVADADSPYDLFAAELLLEPLGRPPLPRVEVPSRYPGIAVDTTLEHPRHLPWAALAAEVERRRAPELREFGLKDRFEGEGVAQGHVRTTLWFSYQSSERSLTQEEVNRAHAALTERLARRAAEDVG